MATCLSGTTSKWAIEQLRRGRRQAQVFATFLCVPRGLGFSLFFSVLLRIYSQLVSSYYFFSSSSSLAVPLPNSESMTFRVIHHYYLEKHLVDQSIRLQIVLINPKYPTVCMVIGMVRAVIFSISPRIRLKENKNVLKEISPV